MQHSILTRTRILALLAGALLAGCSSGGGNGTGAISIALSDAKVDNATKVVVVITGVRLKPRGGQVIERIFTTEKEFDLLTLTGMNTGELLNDEIVPAGAYNWIELLVRAEFDNIMDSYAMLDSGPQVELEVPSISAGQGVRMVSGFVVPQGGAVSFIIDWDLRKALTDALGQPGLYLRPALRISNLAEVGAIAGTVAPEFVMAANCMNDLVADTGNAVYVWSGADATPDDIDGDGDPLATASVQQNDAGDYEFLVAYLPAPAEYTVLFTCQAGGDDTNPGADDAIEFIELPADQTPVMVNVDETTEVSFEPVI